MYRTFEAAIHSQVRLVATSWWRVRNRSPSFLDVPIRESRRRSSLTRAWGTFFVIRVAGNIVAPSQIGSVEFAAECFGTRLVVILGHSGCGAVLATLEELKRPTEGRSPNLRSIVDRIRPSVEPLFETDLRHSPDELMQRAVRANIRAAANNLRHGSRVLEQLIQEGELLVVGAEYSLDTGVVDFFDGLPVTG